MGMPLLLSDDQKGFIVAKTRSAGREDHSRETARLESDGLTAHDGLNVVPDPGNRTQSPVCCSDEQALANLTDDTPATGPVRRLTERSLELFLAGLHRRVHEIGHCS